MSSEQIACPITSNDTGMCKHCCANDAMLDGNFCSLFCSQEKCLGCGIELSENSRNEPGIYMCTARCAFGFQVIADETMCAFCKYCKQESKQESGGIKRKCPVVWCDYQKE